MGFALAKGGRGALNLFIMDKEGAIVQPVPPDARTNSNKLRGRTWMFALLVGAGAGIAIGNLNLAAAADGGKLQHIFRIFDQPLFFIVDAALGSHGPLPETSRIENLMFAELLYWTVIGMFL